MLNKSHKIERQNKLISAKCSEKGPKVLKGTFERRQIARFEQVKLAISQFANKVSHKKDNA